MGSSLSSPSSQLHVCSDGRDSWEWWLFVSVAHFEFVVLLSDSLTVAPIKVLGVVQSSKCFVLKWKTACGFSTCVVRIFLYHDFAYVKSVTKISKGYKKWNCFSKTGLNTSSIVSIVQLELQRQLQKWFLLSANSTYLKERWWFVGAIRICFWPDIMLRVTAFFVG